MSSTTNRTNNNNSEEDPDYPDPMDDGVLTYNPNKPIEGVSRQINLNYGKLYKFIDNEQNLTKEELNDFLKQYSICLLNSDGNSDPKWDTTMERHLNGSFCSFLGNKASGSVGCKLSELPSKLKVYTQFMSNTLIYIFKTKLTPQLRGQIITDTETTKYLEYAIRNLFLFFGQKQVYAPFQGEAAAIFNNFVDSMNELFDGYKIIRVTCPKEEYGCGRFIGRRKCTNSEKWYIFIHKTGGETGNGRTSNLAANNTNSVVNKESSSCGGARKTRRSKQRGKKRKTRISH